MDISQSNAHSTPGNMFEYFILKFTEQWSKYVMRKKHTLVCIHNKELFTNHNLLIHHLLQLKTKNDSRIQRKSAKTKYCITLHYCVAA